ncbi:MAG: hypothetical protein QM308_08920 [Bacillota bacterium]|nr:hypothetical protein [Bacillota bacterium]
MVGMVPSFLLYSHTSIKFHVWLKVKEPRDKNPSALSLNDDKQQIIRRFTICMLKAKTKIREDSFLFI